MNIILLRRVLVMSILAVSFFFFAHGETKWGSSYFKGTSAPILVGPSSLPEKPTWAKVYREYAQVERVIEAAKSDKAEGRRFNNIWMSMVQLQNLLVEKNNAILAMREEWETQGLLRLEFKSLMNWLDTVDKEAQELMDNLDSFDRQRVGNEDHQTRVGQAFVYTRHFQNARKALAEEVRRLRNVVLKYRGDYSSDSQNVLNIQDMIVKYNLIVLFMAADDLYRYRHNPVGEMPLLSAQEAFDLIIYEFDTNEPHANDFTSMKNRLLRWAEARFEERYLQRRWEKLVRQISPYISNDLQEKVVMAAILANADVSNAEWLFNIRSDMHLEAQIIVDYFKSRTKDVSIESLELNRDIRHLLETNSCQLRLRTAADGRN